MKIAFNNGVLSETLSVHVGKVNASSVWKGGTQIWPTNKSRVRRILVEFADDMDGTLLGAYWQHALIGIKAGATATRYMRLEAGDKAYYLFDSPTPLTAPALEWSDGVIKFPYGDGPLLIHVHAGSIITVNVVMPARSEPTLSAAGPWGSATSTFEAPFLPSSQLSMSWGNFAKLTTTGYVYSVKGLPSGTTHYSGNPYAVGPFACSAGSSPGFVGYGWHGVPNPDYFPGDTSCQVSMTLTALGAPLGWLTLSYPAFNVNIRLKVKSVTAEE